MEFTREIYWNVGHGATTLVPMYLLTLAAVALFVNEAWKRIQVYRLGGSLERTDNLVERILNMLKAVLLQTRVLNVRGPGMAHALFFWGFFLLFIGTCLIVLQADFTDLFFGVKFLKGNFYLVFSVVLDIAGLVAILMLGGLLVRRYIVRPAGLETKKDDAFMHCLLFTILLSGFVIEGARMAVTEMGTPLAIWSPVGLLFAKSFAGMSEASLRELHQYTWWFHLVLVIAFIGSIPFTKFRHIFTTSANYLFADLGPTGKLVSLDMEDEDAESFGVSSVSDLTWKDVFDSDACTLCKRCQDRCPAHSTDKPLSPMKIVNQIGEVAFDNPDASLIETCEKDALWSCTTCRACQEICPASIEHVNKIVDMRRNLVLMEGEFPGEEVMAAMEQTEVNGNPLGLGYASRGDWAEELGVKTLAEDPDVDVLYFVGCYASFDKRNIKIAKAFVQLCQAAGVKVGILGKEEKCCGEPMRKMGNEYLYQSLAMENVELIKGYDVKQVVTSCPHCFNTLAKDYRDLDFDVPVENYTTYLERLLKEGRLKIKSEALTCTYHDSCYLGRHNDIYGEPRDLIKAAGGKIVEMEKSRAEAFCCSAGGGRIMAEESLGERINIKRVNMAVETGASTLVSNCPFCLTMFEDGVKGADVEDKLQPLDIAEVLLERLIK
ncbi:MAG: heterodisulfide reductase-related iron-sulfur binding cluster [Desulfuromonadales bacterium]|nr:heterodisulfide reductase-related iron-sulfur binding cluster [Desulfuromonadales bacterium]